MSAVVDVLYVCGKLQASHLQVLWNKASYRYKLIDTVRVCWSIHEWVKYA